MAIWKTMIKINKKQKITIYIKIKRYIVYLSNRFQKVGYHEKSNFFIG